MWKGYYAASDTQHWTDELVCCSVLYCVAVCCSVCEYLNTPPQTRNTGQTNWCVAVSCIVLRYVAVSCIVLRCVAVSWILKYAASDVQHGPVGTISHKSLQHTATHCKTLQHIFWYNLSKVTATHSNKRQHTATHCNTLRHINWNNFSNVNSRLLTESQWTITRHRIDFDFYWNQKQNSIYSIDSL